ncbi:MAG: VacJ family lipoprotein [Nitrospirota bacterium]
MRRQCEGLLRMCLPVTVIGLGGCANWFDHRGDFPFAAPSSPSGIVLSLPSSLEQTNEQPVVSVAITTDQPGPVLAQAAPEPQTAQDEFYDPFAKPGEALSEQEEYDPWERFNSVMFEFNRRVDRYVVKPVAQVYNFILPDRVQVSVSNFFHNVRFVPRFVNNLFQGKVKGAGLELGRFVVNTTLGVAGFFDVAKDGFNWQTPDEDSGQTLGVYGVGPGPYLVLPLLPPLTVRDAVGYVVDLALDPINWLVFPIVEAEGVPSLVAHKNRTTSTFAQLGTRAGQIVNERSLNLETFEGVEEATLDLYTAVRNAYLQKRAKAIRE